MNQEIGIIDRLLILPSSLLGRCCDKCLLLLCVVERRSFLTIALEAYLWIE